MTTASSSNYFMEDPREASRLAEKVNAGEFINKYLREFIDMKTHRILDVGCGPGVIDSYLGINYPAMQITGIDSSNDRIKQAKKNVENIQNISILNAEANHLPFEENSFDLVFCRFLLEYLPDKSKAILEMKRVCRPGGKIILQDLDGQLISMYPAFPLQDELNNILNHLATSGFDPFVGRKLYHWSRMADLKVIKVMIEPYHEIAGTITEKEYKAWELKLEIALPQISEALGGNIRAREFKAAYLDYLKDPNSFLFSNVFTIVAEKVNDNL